MSRSIDFVAGGVALPALLWWLMNRMASAKAPYARTRMDGFGVPMDPVDTWFADYAELPASPAC